MLEALDADENGWARGRIEPLAIDRAWSLLSPESDARIDEERWAHHAKRFFALSLAVAPKKAYPTGASPLADVVELVIVPGREPRAELRARVVTVPMDRAPQVRSRALAIARGPAGGGFEALVLRAKRVWQIERDAEDRAVVAAAVVLASILLAPVLPAGEEVLFGVKTARERLERLGIRT